MTRFAKTLCLPLVFATLFSLTAQGQTGSASAYGTITDQQGAVVVGATVTLTSAKGTARTMQSDASGGYVFTALPPGIYQLKVEAAGFQTVTAPNWELLVDIRTRRDVGLQVGTAGEIVEVTSQAETLNTSDASLGNVITPTQVGTLPLEGLNPVALLTLQAGVSFTGDPTDRRSGAVGGARSDQTNVTLDGTEVNDTQSGLALTSSAVPIPLDSIQEFRFTTANANAEAGRSGGGQVSFVTKSGTNALHGSLFEAHRNTSTSANDWFLKRGQILAGQPNKQPKLIRNVFGGSLGGPVVKDRAFFFVTYEGTRRRAADNALRIVPTPSLRAGQLKYRTSSGVVTLSPAQLKQIDPAGIGVNPAMLAILNSYPACTDFTQGPDGGLNFCGTRFTAPLNQDKNLYVARLDYNLTRDGRHAVSWRGSLANIDQDFATALFPGQPPQQKLLDNSKGFAASYTAQIRPNLISVAHYGFTRQGLDFNGANQPAFTIRDFATPFNQVRATVRKLPSHNIVEDITWVKGSHTVQGGFNFRVDFNNRADFSNSFDRFNINSGFCHNLCNGVRSAINAGAFPGIPAIPGAASNPFKRSLMALYGMITQVNSAQIFDGKNFNLSNGTGVNRRFAAQDYEGYVQDTWKVTRDLTLTLGVRYSYFGVPYERDGLQTQPTTGINNWFRQRALAQANGQPASTIAPLLYDRSGPGVNRAGYYEPDRNNVTPTVAFAWAPRSEGFMSKLLGGAGNSVLRGGFRIAYDRIGGAFPVTNDQNGALGLVTPLINLSGLLDFSGPACGTPPTGVCAAPRFSGLGSLPAAAKFFAVPKGGFPTKPTEDFSSVAFAIDSKLRTPYTYVFNLSFDRRLPGNINLETTYQGRLAHKLLGKEDYAAPLIFLKDTKSGQTLAAAMNQLFLSTGKFSAPTSTVQSVPFFENIYAPLKGTCGSKLPNCTPTQAFYQTYAQPNGADFTDAIFGAELDQLAGSPVTILKGPVFFPTQFSSLPTFTNAAWSNYNALQVAVRKRFGQGLAFDFNYTYSHSIDNASETENSGNGLANPGSTFNGLILDAFNPSNQKASSNFDIRHQLSANYNYELPFGKGKFFGRSASGVLNQIIGGWSTSGIVRWRKGLPFGPGNGFAFPTNFFLTGPGTLACQPKVSFKRFGAGGNPNLFGDNAGQAAALACDTSTLTGGSGSRNAIRGTGFVQLDTGVAKTFPLPMEGHSLIFRWQAFNALNHPNFDDRSLSLNPDEAATFGRFTSTIGADERGNNARVMQFSLRYSF